MILILSVLEESAHHSPLPSTRQHRSPPGIVPPDLDQRLLHLHPPQEVHHGLGVELGPALLPGPPMQQDAEVGVPQRGEGCGDRRQLPSSIRKRIERGGHTRSSGSGGDE